MHHRSVHAALLTGLTSHLLFGLPRRGFGIMLAGQRSIFRHSTDLDALVGLVPRDARTVVARYPLDPVTTTLICCPHCFRLFEYIPGQHSPLRCSGPVLPGGQACGSKLWKEVRVSGRSYTVPLRKQVFQDLRHWLARLLAREDAEDMLENPLRRRRYREDAMYDFWDSLSAIRCKDRNLEPVIPSATPDANHTLRLLFSFSIDGFNPFHMKQAKQTATSTAIWLFLLNLPLHLRYREENSFKFTIIPGSHGPSKEQINHTLDYLVDTLHPFFDPGFSVSRTFKYPLGRTIQGQIVPFIADSPAIRQACGFCPTTGEYFCTACKLRIQDIENLEKSTWPQRSLEEHRRDAEEWLRAPDQQTRDEVYERTGVRWTPFFRLRTFNPIRQADGEVWHIVFEGLCHHYVRSVWGVNWEKEGGDGLSIDSSKVPPRPSDAVMRQWMHHIRVGAEKGEWEDLAHKISNDCLADVSWHICNDLGLRTAGTRSQRSTHIINWVSFAPLK